MMKKDGSE